MSDQRDLLAEIEELREALDLERRKYTGLANSLAQKVWTTTPAGEVDSFNKALADYFSSPSEALMGVDWVAVIHPDDLPLAMAAWGHALETGDPLELECRIQRYDGEYRWHLSRGFPLRDQAGAIIKWYGMISDLTGTREAERLAAIVANTDDAMIALDLDKTVAAWNPGATRLFQLEPQQAIGQPLVQVLPIEDIDLNALIDRCIHTRHAHAVDTRALSSDFGERDLVLTISPILGDSGDIVGISTIARDISARKAMERALTHQALHDALTGLPNRSLFLDRLTNALTRSQRTGAKVAVMFIDLDDFKVINDSAGHGLGDELLNAVGPRLVSLVREVDTVARFGGDEFVVLCDDIASEADINELGDRIVESLKMPFSVGGTSRRVSASVGIAIAHPDSTAEELVSAADTAMYRAKENGRGRRVLFDESLRHRVRARLEIDEQMREALDLGQFNLVYQPILGVHGDKLSFEALLRWQRPGTGAISPADFIPEAERNGLIVPIGDWVLQTACKDAASWSDHAQPPCVSVNLSPRQLDDLSFVDRVVHALTLSGLSPSRLLLEVTETALLQGSSAPVMQRLRELGVGTVLDDFGTGYSSLSHLKLFDLDCIKIDKMFIDGLCVSSVDTSIVNAVIEISGAMGIRVVAEGVEDEAQLTLLRELGCDAIQGYLASKPLPAEDVLHVMAQWAPGMGPLEFAGLLPGSGATPRDTSSAGLMSQ